MFNGELKRQIRCLESDIKDLRQEVKCLRGFHDWIVALGMKIRCKHCAKEPTA